MKLRLSYWELETAPEMILSGKMLGTARRYGLWKRMSGNGGPRKETMVAGRKDWMHGSGAARTSEAHSRPRQGDRRSGSPTLVLTKVTLPAYTHPFASCLTLVSPCLTLLEHQNSMASSQNPTAGLAEKAATKLAARKRFEAVFPLLVEELIEYLASEGMPREAQEWYRRNLDYNTPGGKLNRGLSVVDTVDVLLCTEPGSGGKRTRELTEPEYLKAAILGWCIELVSPTIDRAEGLGSIEPLAGHFLTPLSLRDCSVSL